MVLPPCPMAEFVVPRHSAVMERLRRRIELCRRHHSACESRYQAVSPERLELERQQTFALHQRCLQAKAKRAGKHRQPPPPAAPQPTAPSQPALPAPAPGAVGSTSASSDRPGINGLDADTAGGEQQQQQHGRSSALIALHETVKRKLDSSVSPQNGDQQNGYGDMFSVPKKLRHDDGLGGLSGSSNGIPPVSPRHQLDSKSSSGDTLQLNGKHSMGLDGISKKCLPDPNLQLNGSNDADDSFAIAINKELKQEPDDLPCMIAGAGSSISQNNLMSDLNLNEQEWKELIDELNRSVPDEDMKDLFTEDFEEKKDVDPSNSAAQTPLPQDIIIKTEFSPADFEQEQMGSPQVRSSSSSGTTYMGTSSVPVSAASPAAGNSQSMFQPSNQSVTENPNQSMMQSSNQPQNVQRPLSSSLLSGQSTGSAKEMSSAKQLQQIAAKQKRDQLLQNQQQVHQPNQISSWQQSGPSHSPLAVPYTIENPTSPSVYQQDFSNQKLMMSNMPNKSSPRAGGNFHGGNMLSHQPNSLNQTSVSSQSSVLDYGNTKPLSHYKECGQGVTIPGQNKTPMLAYMPQQRQQPTLPHMNDEQNGMFVMKQKPGNIAYRPLVPHSQDQNPSASVPRIPVSVPGPGVNAQPPNVSMAGNHGNTAYLNNQQQAAVMKQHQMLLDQREQQQKHLLMEQQKQFLMGRRQLLAEQEKQRHHQEQQLQRHLTRPPPQYQDQTQNPYQQQVGQFTGSSPAMAGVNNLGQSNSSSPRMFPQTQNMIQIGAGHSSVSSNSAQQDRGVTQYTSMQNIQRGGLYNMAPGMTQMVPQHANPSANGQPQMQRQPGLAQGTALPAGYGQSSLGNASISHQHSKGALNSTLSKPQMARMPTAIGAQNPSWQHQGRSNMNNQAQGNSGLGTFTASSTFHMQQTHLKMTNQQFAQGMPQVSLNTSRPMASMNSAVSGQMLSSISAQQRTNPPTQQPVPSQQVLPGMSQAVPDLTTFSQNQNQQLPNRANLHCSQGYPVRTAGQELPFAYSNQSGNNGLQSLTGDTDIIDSLLKNRTSEEWMNDLDELLGNH
ncbi:mastermind-like protein 1 isoform X2 [Hemicordylus capensis]|uniref:mastermind-like protein 1 isoform X2 n=1 Tax=Hemicordylus capensis TaxID=884348 RepID=UPI002303976D|nr:mastermind-like protein 1 isoform X2 [Hemicordylus capensis]